MLLPASLLVLVQSFLLFVEAQQQLSLDTVLAGNTTTLPNPPIFTLPSSVDPLYVSISLCASSDSPPLFFVTNDTTISQPGPDNVDLFRVFQVKLGDEGFGSWQGMFPSGGRLQVVKGSTTTPFELLVSSSNATSELDHPYVGDTTSNQALIFSPPFNPEPIPQPTYPNYTLPAANLTFPSEPSTPRNYSLVFATTESSTIKTLPRTTCAIRAAAQRDTTSAVTMLSANQSEGLWLRDPEGWRWQWLVGGLTPRTNYTAYMLQTGKLAATSPLYFVTKSASFSCPLVHNLPFCPSISYAAPLPPPRAPATAHTAGTLPSGVAENIISVLTNFTKTLTTLACGRDLYSPLVTCADCQHAYRTWLCTVSFPRCAEASPSQGAQDTQDAQGAQVPLQPALTNVKAGTTPRNPVLPAFSSDYQTLLPCLETCNAADRACPTFLGFKCPLPKFNAASSYGKGFIDSGDDGEVGGGSTGVAQDVYGNVWCNAG